MGFYINPKDKTKEEWLIQNGIQWPTWTGTKPKDCHFVCLVNNGFFTAAGICFDDQELKEFADDGRPKAWFMVPDDLLVEICPEVKSVLV
jgi:hypothetical protein